MRKTLVATQLKVYSTSRFSPAFYFDQIISPGLKTKQTVFTKKAINVTKQTPFVLSVCVTILRYLSGVYTSCFHMRLPHFVAIFYYLPWSCSIKVSNKNCIAMWKMHAETGCVNSTLEKSEHTHPFAFFTIKKLFHVVNFINILRTNFSHKILFGSFFYLHVTREKVLKRR
jgi:hypothetical protein